MNPMPVKLKFLMVLVVLGLHSIEANAKLVAYWRLDDINGTVTTDSSGESYKGKLHGFCIRTPMEGKYGGAVRFGQTDGDGIEIPTTGLSASQGTISLWTNLPRGLQPARNRYLFGHSKFPHWSNRIQLYFRKANTNLWVGLGDKHVLNSNVKTLQLGIWHHIALTWDHGNYVVFVDGSPEASGKYTRLNRLSSVADIGNDGRTDGRERNEAFFGQIDDVALFNHALNRHEVMQLYSGANDLFISATFLSLLDDISQAENISEAGPPQEVVVFAEKKIDEYNRRSKKLPADTGLHHKRLACELYFILAKAKEATGAPPKDIIEAYKQSVSQLQYRKNHVPALLWLFTNSPRDDYIDAVKKSIDNNTHIPDNLYHIADDFESSKNWDAFELFLKTACNELDNTTCFANAMAKGLKKNGLWARNLTKYSRKNPKLKQYYIEVSQQYASEKMKQNEFQQAADLYRDILNQCDSKHDKLVNELKIYECFVNSGKYDSVLSQLNGFINNNKSDHKDLIANAMLLKGQVYIQLRELTRAYDTFSQLLIDYPEAQKIPEAKFFIGYCKMLEGKLDEAKELLDSIPKYYPDNSYASKSHLCLWEIESIKNSRDVQETLAK